MGSRAIDFLGAQHSFGMTQTQTQVVGSSFSPSFILPSAFFMALGVFFIVLAASILTRRIWR